MIIVPQRNLYLPERKWGQRKFQRGIIMATAIYGGAAGIVVTLTDDTNLAVTGIPNEDVEAGYRVNKTGEGILLRYDRIDGGAATTEQINASTDWVIPHDDTSQTYHIKATEISNTKGGSDSSTGIMNSFFLLTTFDALWFVTRDKSSGDGITQWVIDLEISIDGGTTTEDTGRFTMNAELNTI